MLGAPIHSPDKDASMQRMNRNTAAGRANAADGLLFRTEERLFPVMMGAGM
jgi:hypothetical protein